MKVDKLGWGIVGCGVIGYWHALAVQKNEARAGIVALCDTQRERAEEIARQFSLTDVRIYTDFQEMVRDRKVDVVSVCTPSGLHLEPVLAAARERKHILCEKPIEITLERVDRIIESVESAGVKLGVVFQRRTFEPTRRTRKAIEEGEIGKPVLGSAHLKYYRSAGYYASAGWRGTWALDGGGALMNQGIHGIDLLLHFFGDVSGVQAFAGTLAREIEVEDTAVAALEFRNGALGVIEGSTATNPGLPTRLELCGSKGTITYVENRIDYFAASDDENSPAREIELPPEERLAGGGKVEGKDLEALGHVRLVADLIEAIDTGREPLVPPREARRSVQLILAIYRSARTRMPVFL